MRPPDRTARPRPRAVLAGALLLAVLLLAGCERFPGPLQATPADVAATPAAVPSDLATAAPLQGDDAVDLTLYFRAGQGVNAHLTPVVREVPVSDDLPRRALELLLAGPEPTDDPLDPVVPPSTRLVDLAIEGGTARVVLSDHVLRDVAAVGRSATNEALALAAIANTLTEFTSIERVALDVEGEDAAAAAFWGGWGLPDVLVRDESLVGTEPGEQEGVVELARFSAEAQEVGSASAPPVAVTSIRVRDRITHTRFVVELADPEDADASAKVPPVRVRRANDQISMLVTGIAGIDGDVEETVRLEADPAQFSAARHEVDELGATLRLVLRPTEPRTWWLHTLANPTRIVLDVRK